MTHYSSRYDEREEAYTLSEENPDGTWKHHGPFTTKLQSLIDMAEEEGALLEVEGHDPYDFRRDEARERRNAA